MDPGALGSLGVGTGFAMAAKLAHPNKEVLCYYGDGSFGMTAFDMETADRFGAPYHRGHRQQLGDEPDPLRPDRQIRRSSAATSATSSATCSSRSSPQMLGGCGEEVREPGEDRAGPAARRARRSPGPASRPWSTSGSIRNEYAPGTKNQTMYK